MTASGQTAVLGEEREFFDRSLSEWLGRFPGKVVLVKGQELIGVFDTEQNALAEGARRFQLQPFLVRRVQDVPADICIPALTLGILRGNADTSHST